MDAEAQLQAFIDRYDPELARLGRAARAKLKSLLPSAFELVYDNYNALVFAFAPGERSSEAILSIAMYPRYLTLFFARGVELDDPEELLEGTGKTFRSIRLASATDLKKSAIQALIDQAVLRSEVPLPATGKGRTVVKSVAAKQRPRRPS